MIHLKITKQEVVVGVRKEGKKKEKKKRRKSFATRNKVSLPKERERVSFFPLWTRPLGPWGSKEEKKEGRRKTEEARRGLWGTLGSAPGERRRGRRKGSPQKKSSSSQQKDARQGRRSREEPGHSPSLVAGEQQRGDSRRVRQVATGPLGGQGDTGQETGGVAGQSFKFLFSPVVGRAPS